MTGTVTILGINGHIGHEAARAFQAAGWRVVGFGRSYRRLINGVTFCRGDANDVADIRRAIAGADVVVNALNLPYDKWFGGAAEAQFAKVLTALDGSGKTLMLPGNIYNYSATDRKLTPDLAQNPQTERGAIRVRIEQMMASAARKGDIKAIILRAGDFFAPGMSEDWFSSLILREAKKHKIALNPNRTIGHAWAYLPDLARAFVVLAEQRHTFGTFENFHFAGHHFSANEMMAAIEKSVRVTLRPVDYPWAMLRALGVFMPIMREIVKMRYLWDNDMALIDDRLQALLGPDFATPLDQAIAATVAPYFADEKIAA